jgi:hypothetical protein
VLRCDATRVTLPIPLAASFALYGSMGARPCRDVSTRHAVCVPLLTASPALMLLPAVMSTAADSMDAGEAKGARRCADQPLTPLDPGGGVVERMAPLPNRMQGRATGSNTQPHRCLIRNDRS